MENVLRWDVAVKWMESLLPWLEHIAMVLVYFWVAVLLPMSMLRRTRMLIARSLQICSWYMGALCCWLSVIVTYQIAGWMAASIGLLAGIIGIIPMAIAGSAIEKDWNNLSLLLVGLALILIPRTVAKLILNRGERARLIRVRHYAEE